MTEQTDELPGLGHNNPPEALPYDVTVLDELRKDVESQTNTAGEWLNKGIVTDKDQAGLAGDFVAGMRKIKKRTEDARAAAKAIHKAKADAAYAAFTPLVEACEKALKRVLDMLNAFMVVEQKRLDEEKAAAAAAAAEAAAKAQAELEAARENNDIMAEVEAEAAAKAAAKEVKSAGREVKVKVGSATGGGRTVAQREQKTAVIFNHRMLFMHLQDDPTVIDALQRVANARIRAADWDGEDLPGTKTERKAVAA